MPWEVIDGHSLNSRPSSAEGTVNENTGKDKGVVITTDFELIEGDRRRRPNIGGFDRGYPILGPSLSYSVSGSSTRHMV